MNPHRLGVVGDTHMHYLFFILIYAFTSYALYRIAERLSVPRPWFALIPFAREWLLVSMTGKSWKWFVLLLIPVVNIPVAYLVWGDVARKLSRSVWLGRAMVVPILNLVLLGALAFEFSCRDVLNFLINFAQKMYRAVRDVRTQA
jgi:hypothetical protein